MSTIAFSREEILAKVKDFGITVSPATLNRYVAADLITAPKHQALGRGKGSRTAYHPGAHIELAVAWCLKAQKIPVIGYLQDAFIPIKAKYVNEEIQEARIIFSNDFRANISDYKGVKELLPLIDEYIEEIESSAFPSAAKISNEIDVFMHDVTETIFQEQDFLSDAPKPLSDLIYDFFSPAIQNTQYPAVLVNLYQALFLRFMLWDIQLRTKSKKINWR